MGVNLVGEIVNTTLRLMDTHMYQFLKKYKNIGKTKANFKIQKYSLKIREQKVNELFLFRLSFGKLKRFSGSCNVIYEHFLTGP